MSDKYMIKHGISPRYRNKKSQHIESNNIILLGCTLIAMTVVSIGAFSTGELNGRIKQEECIISNIEKNGFYIIYKNNEKERRLYIEDYIIKTSKEKVNRRQDAR